MSAEQELTRHDKNMLVKAKVFEVLEQAEQDTSEILRWDSQSLQILEEVLSQEIEFLD